MQFAILLFSVRLGIVLISTHANSPRSELNLFIGEIWSEVMLLETIWVNYFDVFEICEIQ